MTSITWASLRYVQELTTILGHQNRTQGSREQDPKLLPLLWLLSSIRDIIEFLDFALKNDVFSFTSYYHEMNQDAL